MTITTATPARRDDTERNLIIFLQLLQAGCGRPAISAVKRHARDTGWVAMYGGDQGG
jgi:hypothetical protein